MLYPLLDTFVEGVKIVKGLTLITVTQGRTCTEKLLNCYVLYLTLLLKVRRLFQESPYHFSQESNVDIMDGPDEGLFAWITVNFLLGTKYLYTIV